MRKNGTAGRRTDTRAIPAEETPLQRQRIIVIDPNDEFVRWLEEPENRQLMTRALLERAPAAKSEEE